ncbi:MAG: tetratricopeptide repeat protein [Methanosarcinaceae archaeon]|nr:tetratricopeptide repeat protein [Methanosarcinaceae archaeon]
MEKNFGKLAGLLFIGYILKEGMRRGKALKVRGVHRQGKVPINSRAGLKRGFSARLSEKRYERLLKKAEDELRESPEEVRAWEMKGFALLSLEKFDEALEAFDKVAKLSSERERSLELKSLAHYSLKYYLGAVRGFEDKLVGGKDGGVEEPFELALAKNPLNAEAWNYQGIVLKKLGGYKKALEAFETALELDPEYGKAKLNRDLLLAKL